MLVRTFNLKGCLLTLHGRDGSFFLVTKPKSNLDQRIAVAAMAHAPAAPFGLYTYPYLLSIKPNVSIVWHKC